MYNHHKFNQELLFDLISIMKNDKYMKIFIQEIRIVFLELMVIEYNYFRFDLFNTFSNVGSDVVFNCCFAF